MKQWWRGCVIYQIYPRSFQDSSDNGIGDLNGITERLHYISRLGVDCIWLSPIFMSPMQDMGYDVCDYTNIDPIFGTLDDFDRLVERSHSLGLKVIIDQVLSHSSDQHPFFQESRQDKDNSKSDWYVWSDPKEDGSPPNNWLSIFGGPAWEWEPLRRQYYLHNFLASQPDFNFHNSEVQDWLLTTVQFWLDRKVDGFRLDTVNYYFHNQKLLDNPPKVSKNIHPPINLYYMQDHRHSINQPENIEFIERFRALLDEYKDRTSVGEISNFELMALYTEGKKKLHMAYSFELLGPVYTANHFRQSIEDFLNITPKGWACWSFSNHDVIRHVSRWIEDINFSDNLAKQAAAILLSLEGSICLYQGEELGQLETDLEYGELQDPPGVRFWPENKGRDGCRTPMIWNRNLPNGGFSEKEPWLPVKKSQLSHDVKTQDGSPSSVLSFYRSMMEFRKDRKELQLGSTLFHDVLEPLLAFSRKYEETTLLCLFNLSLKKFSIKLKDIRTIPHSPSLSAKVTKNKLSIGHYGFIFLQVTGEKPLVLDKSPT